MSPSASAWDRSKGAANEVEPASLSNASARAAIRCRVTEEGHASAQSTAGAFRLIATVQADRLALSLLPQSESPTRGRAQRWCSPNAEVARSVVAATDARSLRRDCPDGVASRGSVAAVVVRVRPLCPVGTREGRYARGPL